MRKQFTAFLAVLTLSTLLVGCTSKEQPASDPVESTIIENAALEEEIPSEATEETAPAETEVAAEADNEKAEETEAQKLEEAQQPAEKEPAKETASSETKKEETAKPAASSKPAAAPSTSTSAQTSSNSSSSKPAAKPSTNSSAHTTNEAQPAKPESAAPAPAPSQSPEADTASSPEAPKEEETALSCSQIFASITKGIELGRQMDADADMLRDFYGIDTSLLEDYCVKMPQMSFQITEIGVFKVKDANNVSSIISGIDQRANNIGQCLYPSLQETFDSRVVVTKGNYILFAIADDAAALSSAFNSLVK